jgi:NADPH:quinone reductase
MTAERAPWARSPGQTFARPSAPAIRGDVRHRYPLAAAAEAHRDLESRRSTGSLVLLP